MGDCFDHAGNCCVDWCSMCQRAVKDEATAPARAAEHERHVAEVEREACIKAVLTTKITPEMTTFDAIEAAVRRIRERGAR